MPLRAPSSLLSPAGRAVPFRLGVTVRQYAWAAIPIAIARSDRLTPDARLTIRGERASETKAMAG